MPLKKCPNCQKILREAKVGSTYDDVVNIEQCDGCGGLWFDNLEIYRIKNGAAYNLDNIDKDKLNEKVILASDKLICPNDGATLNKFTDKLFPETLQMDNCPLCGGLWLNRGEFTEFQINRNEIITNSQRKKINSFEEDKEFKDEMRKLFELEADKGYLGAAAGMGQFLMTAINPINNRPIEDLDPEMGDKVQKTVEVALGIMNLVFRLFLH